MTFPPPPPDRTHLQYQPAPVPQQQPPQMGPGGAYGPMQQSSDQPIPGQLPSAGMMMTKPGTVTGIQVILWIFVALGAIANLFSIISMVDFFHPLQLLVLAYAVYSTIQSLVSPVQIARGKRWAWIWSLVNAILGLLTAIAALVFGILYFDNGGEISLLIGVALTGLYGTLLGLLCSKSARQWIIMHRIQRGEVAMPGAAGGFAGQPGMAPGGPGGFGAGAAPQRPETRPTSVAVTAVALGAFAALAIWQIIAGVTALQEMLNWFKERDFPSWEDRTLVDEMFSGQFPQLGHQVVALAVLVIGAAIIVPLLLKGSLGGRVLGIIWSIPAVLITGFIAYVVINDYNRYYSDLPLFGGPAPMGPGILRTTAVAVAALLVFILMMTPGVRAWTPGNPSTAAIVMVPMGQPQQTGPYGQAPQAGPYGQTQQTGPYGQQQSGPYGSQSPQQQSPYPPQY
ncbi:hypothetical protein [Glycomyces sp. NRRL B-16210]|uniref:hypothetical protein n=1 Tax=Glycomyces sp. NRRL B-16210 TaxID=1463821 RepID=UPI000AFDDCBF|nr:hypothetical protein [Glycomyces sp. NRRL B-16210]